MLTVQWHCCLLKCGQSVAAFSCYWLLKLWWELALNHMCTWDLWSTVLNIFEFKACSKWKTTELIIHSGDNSSEIIHYKKHTVNWFFAPKQPNSTQMVSSVKAGTSLVRSLQQMVSEWYLLVQVLVCTILLLILKLPQTNCGASNYFHRALMLTVYLLYITFIVSL